MQTSLLHRIATFVALLALVAAVPMVLCAQVETCAPMAGMADCGMTPDADCCIADPTPAPASPELKAKIALLAPPTGFVGSGPELTPPDQGSTAAGRSTGTAAPIPLYTLLATLLI